MGDQNSIDRRELDEIQRRLGTLEREKESIHATLKRFERAVITGDIDTGTLALVARVVKLEAEAVTLKRQIEDIQRSRAEDRKKWEKDQETRKAWRNVGYTVLGAVLIAMVLGMWGMLRRLMEAGFI